MKRDSKQLTLGAMLSVLTIITLYSSAIFATIEFTILGLASLLMAIAVMETGRKTSLLVYISSSLVGLLFVPNKSIVFGYVLFMGYYPILKHIIEARKTLALEWFLKILTFNATLMLNYLFLIQFIPIDLDIPLPLNGAFMLAQVVFVIYDITLTAIIGYYIAKVRCKLPNNL